MAPRTLEQIVEDRRDQIVGNDGHGPVYRFDAADGTFELVDDEDWDGATGDAIGCGGQPAQDSPFLPIQAGTGRTLFYNDQAVPVVGGNAVFVWDALDGNFVAVLSAEGGGGIPFLSAVRSSGQHYHQLFSEETGEPVGDPVRLPFSGSPNSPRGCRSPDGGFMLYSESSEGRFDRICIVDVREFMPQPDEDEEGGEQP